VSTAALALRIFIMAVVSYTAMQSAPGHSEQPAIARIGVLVPPRANSTYEAGLRDGLRELGYVEGKNVITEWLRSAGAEEEERSLVADLAREKVDVIVVFNTVAARAALDATTTIPVVFLSNDPVASGLADSVARPGRNATGVSGLMADLTGKRLEFLQQLAPAARRIVCLVNSSNPSGLQQLDAAQKAARTLGLQLITLDAHNEGELDTALRALPRNAENGVLVTADRLFYANKTKITQAIRKAGVAATFPYRDYHDGGALMSYGPSTKELARKMAVYVDKILKGARPGDLPIEQISVYELIVDLRVARELGLKVPQDLLMRADEVIR
jgi:putative ABC transport system substrate-binding protein